MSNDASKRLSLSMRLMLLALLTLLCVFFAEVALRVIGFRPITSAPQGTTVVGYFWIADQTLGFRNRAHGDFVYHRIAGAPRITTDANGYRQGVASDGRRVPPSVLIVGDSTAFCAEVGDDQTGAAEIEKLLADVSPARVINAGVRGYSTIQAKRMMQEALEHYPSIQVVLYLYTPKDYLENLNPIVHYPAKAPAGVWDGEALREIEVTDPVVPWGTPLASVMKGGVVAAAPSLRIVITDAMRSRSALVQLVLSRLRQLVGKPANPLRLERLPDGSLGPMHGVHGDDPRWQEQFAWARKRGGDRVLEQTLAQMQALAEERGARFFATKFTRGEVEEQEEPTNFWARCEAAAVWCVDISSSFGAEPTDYAAALVDGGFDAHYGPKGTVTFAKAIAPGIRKLLASVDAKRTLRSGP